MIIFYYNHYYGFKESLISAKTPYQYSNNISEIKELFDLNDKKKDFRFLKSTLANIGVSVPTLYKQYSEIAEDGGIKFLHYRKNKHQRNNICTAIEPAQGKRINTEKSETNKSIVWIR